MARVSGPLFSRAASGSLAGTITFLPGTGQTRVRRYRTSQFQLLAPQVAHQAMYGFLASEWKNLTTAQHDTWANVYQRDRLTNFQQFVKYNLERWGHYKAPSQTYPATETGTQASNPSETLTPGFHHVDMHFNFDLPNDRWGMIIHESTINGFTPTRATATHVWHSMIDHSPNYADMNLQPGTYYYRPQPFTTAGKLAALRPQQTKIVT